MRLNGTASNTLAAGAKITVSAGGQQYYKQIYLGEQYLSQNSQWQNFGIGTAAQIDSVTIDWPSGFVETYLNLDADTNYTFTEGATLQHEIVNQSGTSEFCEGDSIRLSGQAGYLQYNWSDGQHGQTVYIRHSDTISLQVFDGMFYIQSDTLIVSELRSPVDSIRIVNPTCFGNTDGEIELVMNSGVDPVEIHWSQGQTSGVLSSAAAGLYQVEVIWSGTCHMGI
ncbi:MAG: ASPIC/UnbV domain-containing protein [Bacteroidia bacterium]